jgi:hypothetical protein
VDKCSKRKKAVKIQKSKIMIPEKIIEYADNVKKLIEMGILTKEEVRAYFPGTNTNLVSKEPKAQQNHQNP